MSIIKLLAIFAFSFHITTLVISEAKAQSLNLEAYASLPDVEYVSISPDGTRLAFLSRKSGSSVVVVTTMKGEKIGAVDVSKLKPRNLYFATNDVVIISASDYYSGPRIRENEWTFNLGLT